MFAGDITADTAALPYADLCYDAWYVAIAEALGVPLSTLDVRPSRAPGTRCRFSRPSG